MICMNAGSMHLIIYVCTYIFPHSFKALWKMYSHIGYKLEKMKVIIFKAAV